MLFVARVGDLAPAPILFPAHLTVIVNGQFAAQPGSIVTPHGKPPHSFSFITPIVPSTVLVNTLFIRKVGDFASCGHPIITGAPTVFST